MKQEFRGFKKVFGFTFSRQTQSKGWRALTVLLSVFLFLLPILITCFSSSASEEEYRHQIKTVYVADTSGTAEIDYSVLNSIGLQDFENISYKACQNLSDAGKLSGKEPHSLILSVEKPEENFSVNVLLPENSSLTHDDADAYVSFLSQGGFDTVLMLKSNLSPSQLSGALAFPEVTVSMPQDSAQDGISDGEDTATSEDEFHGAKSVLSMVLPYLNIMVLYFLILAYGQGIANSIIMEKTSKLMDTFLVSVKPTAMIFGKVIALALAGLLQFFLWIAALLLGIFASSHIEKTFFPSGKMALTRFLENLTTASGMFSLGAALLAILMVICGFLLFCSLAAIGASLAGKQEDLASTNVLFSLALITSFLVTLYAGGFDSMGASSVMWLNFVPFTAVLVTPSRILLGQISLTYGLISLAITLMLTAALLYLAGKIYKMMVMYKGNPPSLDKGIKMLKQK